jgi:predicted nucleic acid-binding protein
LLIDERRGRAVAAQAGVPVVGLLGVLILARKRNLIPSLTECISDLRRQAGFFLADTVVKKAIQAAGE